MQSQSYAYDLLGKLTSRADVSAVPGMNVTETFDYDGGNRLITSVVKQNITSLTPKAVSYNPVGNIVMKSDVGNYAYPGAGAARPHGVLSISGGVLSTSFTYDPNGNQLSGNGITYAYTSYDKPSVIARGSSASTFVHEEGNSGQLHFRSYRHAG